MDHYTKTSSVCGESEEKKEPCDIHVKSGSKIRNIIAQASRVLQNKKQDKIILTGSGPTVTKAITCAEIIKRKSRGLHQLNKLFYTKTEDTWEPKEESLDKLQVTRRIPSISITLSKVPLDATQPGYQAPGKSKSPVQFGDEDWDLAWEEDSAKATQSKNNAQLDKSAKSRLEGNEDGKTTAKSTKTPHNVAHGNSEDHAENGANGGLPHEGPPQDSTCESHEGHLQGATVKKEQAHTMGSQRTDSQGSKSTQRRPKDYRYHKPKPSPKKKKSEES